MKYMNILRLIGLATLLTAAWSAQAENNPSGDSATSPLEAARFSEFPTDVRQQLLAMLDQYQLDPQRLSDCVDQSREAAVPESDTVAAPDTGSDSETNEAGTRFELNWDQLTACLEQPIQTLDEIVVTGKYIGLDVEVPEIAGRYVMNRAMIDASPKGNGEISELLAVLPGVQLGDETLSADEAGEIKAKRVSISGGQAWQTGFFLDGVNINSRQDPASYNRDVANINDVAGSAQSVNINEQLVETIEVFDNNIPAQYGDFSGGVVEVSTREPDDEFRYGIGVRANNSSWGEYHVFLNDEDVELPSEPEYEKRSYSLNMEGRISEHHKLMLVANHSTSDITKVSFDQAQQTSRENSNLMLKLVQQDLWVDQLEWTVNVSPYESKDLLVNVKDSDISIKGGGYSTSLKLQQEFDDFTLKSKLAYNLSENSRRAPQHYLPWIKSLGKEWGIDGTGLSREGGYGDIDKTQQTLGFDLDLTNMSWNWGNSQHWLQAGVQLNHEQLERQRFNDSYVYSNAQNGIQDLNCSGFTLDCIELQRSMTEEELAAQLGVDELDFNNAEHIAAYEATIISSPQYFKVRRVYHAEHINVAVNKAAAYITDTVDWHNWTLNLGLRYETDDFFGNHNIAPRISAGYRLFGDEDRLITLGFNRYYDSNLLTYKVREKQTPYSIESRALNSDNYVQGWQTATGSGGSRYVYKDVKTPYNDEVVVGWKHATWAGNYSIKYVQRWQRDQLVRSDEDYYNPTDGYTYRYQVNEGEGLNRRVSVSWALSLDEHSLWANSSYQISQSYNGGYDTAAEDTDEADLVALYTEDENGEGVYTETSRDSLERFISEFGQPLTVNFGWSSHWSDRWMTSLFGSFRGGYKSWRDTGSEYESTQIIANSDGSGAGTSLAIPVYEEYRVPKRWLFNAAMSVKVFNGEHHQLTLRTDINNLFNSRTFTVADGDSGIELGRQFWFGVNYDFR